MNGWIKLHRRVMDNSFCKRSAERLGFWVMILLKANHEGGSFFVGHQKITCRAGEFVTGRNVLAKECGVSPSSVDRWLRDLESEHQIEQQMTTKFRLIKVINWKKYQTSEHQIEQQLSSNRAATEQQLNTNKKNKNDKNEKNDMSSEIVHWLRKMEIENPEAYLSSLSAKVNPEALRKAWRDAKRGVGITNPSGLWSRSLHYNKKL